MTEDIWKTSDDICNLIFDAAAMNERYEWSECNDADDDLPALKELDSLRARYEGIKSRGLLMRWFALACHKRYNTDRPHPKYDSWHRWAVEIISSSQSIGFLESAEQQEYYLGPYLSWGCDAVNELVAELRAEATVAIEIAVQQQNARSQQKGNDFAPTIMQSKILTALNGRALKKQPLANEVCCGDASCLYRSRKLRKGDLNELIDLELVQNKPDLGYYRPDVPPKVDH